MPWTHAKKMEYQRNYRKDNRESLNSKRRLDYSENRESEKAYRRKWRSEHPELLRQQQLRANSSRRAQYPHRREVILAQIKKSKSSNPERCREYNRIAYRRHRAKIIERSIAGTAKRRARKKSALIGDISIISQWEKEIRSMNWARCHWCGTKVAGGDVHFDHVLALSKGGSQSSGNLCSSCPDCNRRKSARIISDWVVGGQSFLPI